MKDAVRHCGAQRVRIKKQQDFDPNLAKFPYTRTSLNQLEPEASFAIQINEFLKTMLCILHQDDRLVPVKDKYVIVKPMITDMFRILWKRKEFVKDRIFWEEMYHISTYFYKLFNTHPSHDIGGIPTVRVTKHNDAAWFWVHIMREKKWNMDPSSTRYVGTLVHVDTHCDDNAIQYPIVLRKVGKRVLDGKATEHDWKVYRTLAWDIGAAVTAFQVMTRARDWFWIYPQWIRHKENDMDVVLGLFHPHARLRQNDPPLLKKMYKKRDRLVSNAFYNVSDFSLRDVPKMVDGPETELIKVSRTDAPLKEEMDEETLKEAHPRFAQVFAALEPAVFRARKPHTPRQWREIGEELSPRYILDMDLDYFCSNGKDPYKKSYEKETYDVHSFGRVDVPNFSRFPRSMTDGDHVIEMAGKKVKREVKMVRQRIVEFLRGIRLLKRMGKVPSIISLSDSTGVNFGEKEYFSFGNEYLPRYFALFVHMFLIDGLKRIFG